jgi:hypothetical protein
MANDPYGGNYNYARDIFNMNKQQQALGQQGISPQAIDAILGANARADQERMVAQENIGISKERNRILDEQRKAEEERLRDQQRWANYTGIGQAIGNTALLGPMAYQGWQKILGGGTAGATGAAPEVAYGLGGEAIGGYNATGQAVGSYGANVGTAALPEYSVAGYGSGSYAPTVMVDGASAAIPAEQAIATGAGATAGEGAAAGTTAGEVGMGTALGAGALFYGGTLLAGKALQSHAVKRGMEGTQRWFERVDPGQVFDWAGSGAEKLKKVFDKLGF